VTAPRIRSGGKPLTSDFGEIVAKNESLRFPGSRRSAPNQTFLRLPPERLLKRDPVTFAGPDAQTLNRIQSPAIRSAAAGTPRPTDLW
jgi:hypothetical protein